MSRIIYGLINTSSKPIEVFYVGMTIKSVDTRFKTHINEAKAVYGKSGTRKERKLNKLLRTNSADIIILEQNDYWTIDQLKDRERYWIAYFRAQQVDLTNSTDGGDGTHGYKFTSKQIASIKEGIAKAYEQRGDAIRAQMKASSRNRWDNTDERAKQSKKMKTSNAAKNHRKKLHKALKGRKLSDSHKKAISIGTQDFFNNHPEVGKAQSKRMKEKNKDPKYREKTSKALKAAFNDPNTRDALIESRRRAGAVTNSMSVECASCGMISTPGPLGIHLKATGHKKK